MRDKGDLQPGNEYSEAYTLQDRIRDIFLFCRKAGRHTEYTLDEAVCGRFTEFESSHKAVCGTKNYALFAVHDELIGDADMLDNMAMVFESGYRLLLDSKGGHRLRAASLKLLHKEISK